MLAALPRLFMGRNMGTVFNSLSRFFRSTAGNTTILFALASVPLFLAAGAAVDYVRYNNALNEVQSALDGAALAAAMPQGKTEAERIQIAKNYFERNVKSEYEGMQDLDVKIKADSVRVRLRSRLPTTFMGLAGYKSIKIDELAEVSLASDGSAEIVLVLDYSGSMNERGKYDSMAEAADTMIANLGSSIPAEKLKVGLVPFSAMVYTDMNRDYVFRASGTEIWTGCTQDRGYPHNTNVNTPTADNATKWGYIDGSGQNSGTKSCPNYNVKGLKIRPLTNDLASLRSALSVMRPLGYTNIPLGAEFGWNLLDPQLPYDEAQPYSNESNRKFLVLLTDGVQTSPEFGEDGQRSVDHAEQNLVELCTNMRAAGITVFTIAYDITDPDVTNLLKACAPGRYYEPSTDGEEIAQVFGQITRKIKNQMARLAK